MSVLHRFSQFLATERQHEAKQDMVYSDYNVFDSFDESDDNYHDHQYNDDSEQEHTGDYVETGYAWIYPTQIIDDRYFIIRKLGWGVNAIVWLAWDLIDYRANALKITVADEVQIRGTKEEIFLLKDINRMPKTIRGYYNFAHLIRDFKYEDKNGIHYVLVFDVFGPNLLKVMHKFKDDRIPFDLMKPMINSFIDGLAFLHETCGIIHTDIKVENIMTKLSDIKLYQLLIEAIGTLMTEHTLKPSFINMLQFRQGKIYPEKWINPEKKQMLRKINAIAQSKIVELRKNQKIDADSIYQKYGICPDLVICDLNLANYCDDRTTYKIATRQYRSPETLLGYNDWDFKVDIWAAGCSILEALTGKYAFACKRSKRRYVRQLDHIRLIIQMNGEIPKNFLKKCHKKSHFFDKQNNLKESNFYPPMSLTERLEPIIENKDDLEYIISVLEPMLKTNPAVRFSAIQMQQLIDSKK